MASKVMVKIPVAPFGQVNKSKSGSVNGELVAVARTSQDVTSRSQDSSPRSSDGTRVAQLEQNIRFLQEQHQLMLAGLHKEIESLRNKNRELQFQLIFAKGTIPSSPSSPEEDTKHKVYVSPKQVNITPLQVELLEKELGELKIQLQEIEGRNIELSSIVEEQQKKLENYDHDRENRHDKPTPPDPDLLRKLEDAEVLIRKLQRENSDLRREYTASGGPSQYHSPRDGPGYHGGRENNGSYQPRNGQNHGNNKGNGGGGGRHRGNHYRGNWFPPLHSQNYWQSGRANNERSSANGAEANTLPNLQQNGTSSSGGHGHQYQGRRGTNNNHYHNGDGRKYRGGQSKNGKPS